MKVALANIEDGLRKIMAVTMNTEEFEDFSLAKSWRVLWSLGAVWDQITKELQPNFSEG